MCRTFAVLCLVAIAGCSTSVPTTQTFAIRHLQAGREDILVVAQRVLLDMGFSIANHDEISGVITTQPEFSDAPSGARLGTPREQRRIIEIRAAETSSGANVYCRAVIEELITAIYQFQAADQRMSDSGDTPIDRDAATTREQNSVWRMVRRDTLLERNILAEVERRLISTDDRPTPLPQP